MRKLILGIVFLSLAKVALCATLESVGLSHQIIQNIYGLVQNVNDNAAAYKRDLSSGRLTIEQLEANMKGDAVQYVRRVKWVEDLITRNQAEFNRAIAALGIDPTEVQDTLTTLRDISETTQAARLDSPETVGAEADRILAVAPKYERIF